MQPDLYKIIDKCMIQNTLMRFGFMFGVFYGSECCNYFEDQVSRSEVP